MRSPSGTAWLPGGCRSAGAPRRGPAPGALRPRHFGESTTARARKPKDLFYTDHAPVRITSKAGDAVLMRLMAAIARDRAGEPGVAKSIDELRDRAGGEA